MSSKNLAKMMTAMLTMEALTKGLNKGDGVNVSDLLQMLVAGNGADGNRSRSSGLVRGLRLVSKRGAVSGFDYKRKWDAFFAKVVAAVVKRGPTVVLAPKDDKSAEPVSIEFDISKTMAKFDRDVVRVGVSCIAGKSSKKYFKAWRAWMAEVEEWASELHGDSHSTNQLDDNFESNVVKTFHRYDESFHEIRRAENEDQLLDALVAAFVRHAYFGSYDETGYTTSDMLSKLFRRMAIKKFEEIAY